MARRDPMEEDWDDPDDDEWNSEDDDDTEESDTDACMIPCPYCQAEIHDDSLRCPFCENYLSNEDAPPQRRPWWLVLGIVICLILVLRWILP